MRSSHVNAAVCGRKREKISLSSTFMTEPMHTLHRTLDSAERRMYLGRVDVSKRRAGCETSMEKNQQNHPI